VELCFQYSSTLSWCGAQLRKAQGQIYLIIHDHLPISFDVLDLERYSVWKELGIPKKNPRHLQRIHGNLTVLPLSCYGVCETKQSATAFCSFSYVGWFYMGLMSMCTVKFRFL